MLLPIWSSLLLSAFAALFFVSAIAALPSPWIGANSIEAAQYEAYRTSATDSAAHHWVQSPACNLTRPRVSDCIQQLAAEEGVEEDSDQESDEQDKEESEGSCEADIGLFTNPHSAFPVWCATHFHPLSAQLFD